MADVGEFINDFLQHEYDPVKAREYYLRTRKLKGRKKAKAADPRSKVGYNGKPLKPLGKRIEEDETPEVSPSGAKLVDYDGKGLGKATYADGTVYDPSSGWKRGGLAAVSAARDANNAQRVKSGLKALPRVNPKRRIGYTEQRIIRAKTFSKTIKDPVAKAAYDDLIAKTEKKLKQVMETNALRRRGRGL